MEKSRVEISEEDVLGLMDQFTRVPPLLLKMVVKSNSNVVKSFQSKIEEYKGNLSEEEALKIRRVMEIPVIDLQNILNSAYQKTGQEQLKILSDPQARPFIEKNLYELGEILFPN